MIRPLCSLQGPAHASEIGINEFCPRKIGLRKVVERTFQNQPGLGMSGLESKRTPGYSVENPSEEKAEGSRIPCGRFSNLFKRRKPQIFKSENDVLSYILSTRENPHRFGGLLRIRNFRPVLHCGMRNHKTLFPLPDFPLDLPEGRFFGAHNWSATFVAVVMDSPRAVERRIISRDAFSNVRAFMIAKDKGAWRSLSSLSMTPQVCWSKISQRFDRLIISRRVRVWIA